MPNELSKYCVSIDGQINDIQDGCGIGKPEVKKKKGNVRKKLTFDEQ